MTGSMFWRPAVNHVVGIFAVGAVGALTFSHPATAQQGQLAGVAGGVKGAVKQVLWRSRKTVGRNVASGDRIFLGDRISTGKAARLQIMLLDKTTFTIGPNASMVIDDFVYDGKSGTGKVAARVLKGAFRYVSGTIARRSPSRVTIKLPVATVGIRGTSVVGFTNGTTATLVLTGLGGQNNLWQGPSLMTVQAGGKTVTVYRARWGVVVRGPGLFPSPPRAFGTVQINAIVNQVLGNIPLRRGPNIAVPGRTAAFSVQPPRGPFADIFNAVNSLGIFGDLVTRPPNFINPATGRAQDSCSIVCK